jgi:hypothetical protein
VRQAFVHAVQLLVAEMAAKTWTKQTSILVELLLQSAPEVVMLMNEPLNG